MDGQTSQSQTSLSGAARALGYAGLLPQILCIGLILLEHEWRYAALAGGFAYAAAIFSFLGGVWWGQAVASAKEGQPATTGAYVLAVMPSLLAVALFIHAKLGFQVVIEDYVHQPLAKYALLLFNVFFCFILCALSILAILRLHFIDIAAGM